MMTNASLKERDAAVSDEQAMRDVMSLLDGWQSPDPSPWFEARMMARFREEQQRAPEGWFARLRDRLQLGNPVGYRPLLAGAMALAVVAGGGSYWGFAHTHHVAPASATLQDLQVLDSNAQAIQQMDQLLDNNQDDSDSSGS